MKNHFKKTALLSALLLEISTIAQAAIINVDNSSCTLADAITAANTDNVTGGCIAGDAGADIVELPPQSEIVLSDPLPNIESDITLNANGSTIRRDQNSPDFPVLNQDGYSGGRLTLNDAIISGGENHSYLNNYGGGIDAQSGTLTINRSQITGNSGSGVRSVYTEVNINYSVISNNQGLLGLYNGASGITILGGNLTINKSTISDNKTYGDASGGGLFINYGATVVINNSTISGNRSESGGGAIQIGLYSGNMNSVVLNQVTVTNNSTLENGGAIYNSKYNYITITQSLITGNIAQNAVDEILNCGTFTSNGNNLIGLNGYSSSLFIDLAPGDGVISESYLTDVLNPMLADNGGLTPTHALTPGSPAIDFVPVTRCYSPADQTGKARPIGSGCDVGAFEYDDVIFKDGFD